MGAKIFVGNLHPRTTKSELERFFSAAGPVARISIPTDRGTGEPRGFCFVEFADGESAKEAFSVCDGRELNGRQLRVSLAREEGRRSAAGREKRRGGESSEKENLEGWGFDDTSRGSAWTDPYAERQRAKPRRRGKHGSDRKRNSGARRVIE